MPRAKIKRHKNERSKSADNNCRNTGMYLSVEVIAVLQKVADFLDESQSLFVERAIRNEINNDKRLPKHYLKHYMKEVKNHGNV